MRRPRRAASQQSGHGSRSAPRSLRAPHRRRQPRSGSKGCGSDRETREAALAEAVARKDAAAGRAARARGCARTAGASPRVGDGTLARVSRTISSRPGAGVPRRSVPAELERLANEAAAEARAAATERDDLAERARRPAIACSRSSVHSPSVKALPPAARALAEQGEHIAIAALDVEPGTERAVAAALGRIGSALLASDAAGGSRRCSNEHGPRGLGSLTVLAGRDPKEIVDALPVVPLDELLAARAPPSPPKASASTRGAASSGSPATPPRPCCSRWTHGGGRSRDEADELTARADAAARAADDACRPGPPRRRAAYAAVAHLRERVLDADAARGGCTRLPAGLEQRLAAAVAARRRDRDRRKRSRPVAAAAALARAHGGAAAPAPRRRRKRAGSSPTRPHGAQQAEVALARLGARGRVDIAPETDDRESSPPRRRESLAAAEAAAAAAQAAADRSHAADAALAQRAPRRPAADADLLRRLQSA